LILYFDQMVSIFTQNHSLIIFMMRVFCKEINLLWFLMRNLIEILNGNKDVQRWEVYNGNKVNNKNTKTKEG